MSSTLWQPFSLCYERLNKDEMFQADLFIRSCACPHSHASLTCRKLILGIPHLSTFDETSNPDLVISPSYKSSTPTNYAVCYGVRILLPEYLYTLQDRLTACWKKVADNQDSFGLPDQDLVEFQPALDASLPNTRRGVECWMPDRRRKNLFKGWKIFGLRPKVVSWGQAFVQAITEFSFRERNGICWRWVRAILKLISSPILSNQPKILKSACLAG